jgi:hypothetical protein
MESLIKEYDWSDSYKEIKNHYEQIVNDENCIESSKKNGDTHTIIHRFHGDKIPTWIRNIFSQEIFIIQLFAAEPNSVGYIHKDGVDRHCAFNIPLKNCENGTMDWFDDTDLTTYQVVNDYTSIRITNEQKENGKAWDPIPMHSRIVNNPCLVNTNVWHRIDNRDSKKFRWMISLRFKNNLSFNNMKEFFI